MDAYIALLLDRDQYDSDLDAVRGSLEGLTATMPVTIALPKAEDLVPPSARPGAGGYGLSPAQLPPAELRDDNKGMLNWAMPGYLNLLSSTPFSQYGEGKTYAEAAERGKLGFSGWADKESTDNAPTWETWKEFFNSWRNRGDDSRFKSRGGLYGEGVGEGIDYTEVFMHMANRTIEKWNVDIFGRTLAKLEDKLEEPAFLFVGKGNPGLSTFILNEAGIMREEGEREYMRWLDREALPENKAGLIEEGIGSYKAILQEAERTHDMIQAGMSGVAEIESPSKVTHRIGNMISSGVADGVRSGIPALKRTTKGVINQSFMQARPRVRAAARSGRKLTIDNNFQNVSPEMQAEIKRGVDSAMRFLRVPRARA